MEYNISCRKILCVFSCFLFFLFSWTIFHERSRMEGNYARKYEKLYAQSCAYLALFWSKCYTISDIWSTRLEVYDKGIHDTEKVAYLSGIMFVSKIFEDISWNNIFNDISFHRVYTRICFFPTQRTSNNKEFSRFWLQDIHT